MRRTSLFSVCGFRPEVRNALAMRSRTRDSEGCGLLLTPGLARTQEVLALNGQESGTNAQRDVGTRRNVEGDTGFLVEVSVDSLVEDQFLATGSEAPQR